MSRINGYALPISIDTTSTNSNTFLIVIFIKLCNILYRINVPVFHWTEDCTCNRWTVNSKTVEFVKWFENRASMREMSRPDGMVG
jgi:hypothetical protein